MSFAIDLRPLFDGVVFPILVACLTPLVAYATTRVAQLAHLQITAAQAKILENAMQAGIQFALSRAQDAVDKGGQLHTKSDVIANAANYVLPKVPGALTALGITPTGLAQRIEARLPSAGAPTIAA